MLVLFCVFTSILCMIMMLSSIVYRIVQILNNLRKIEIVVWKTMIQRTVTFS